MFRFVVCVKRSYELCSAVFCYPFDFLDIFFFRDCLKFEIFSIVFFVYPFLIGIQHKTQFKISFANSLDFLRWTRIV